MRSLKKLITMLVAVAMILTSMGIPAFAASFSDITDQRVSEAVDKLVGFNIITGYEDGTFKPDNQITRAEFAAIVTRMKGVADNLSTDAVTGFSDLDNDSSRAWARPYVKAAVDLKIINGFEDGTFRAGEPVTYEQAVKMLVCAVGYEVVARSEYNKIIATNPNATWSAGYIAAANKHGITKGVITAKISEPAARGVVAVLTSNGLDVPEIKENEDGTFEKVDPEEETNQNVEEIKGVVSGTYYTGIDSEDVNIGENEIMIGIGSDKVTYELGESLKESIDFENLIGKYVVAYYDTIDRQITSVIERNNTSVMIDESAIHSISGNTIKYYNENGNLETVSLSGYTIIYNGKYYPDANLENNFKNGTIELLTAGGKKFAKVTSYEVFVVEKYDKTNQKISFKYGKKFLNEGESIEQSYYQFPNRTSDKPEIYVNKVKKDFSTISLSEYNVINYMESPRDTDGNPIKRMYITTGTNTKKVTAGLGEERKVEIDNKEMYLTNDYANYPERVDFELGQTYTYYLDYTGQIAAVNKKVTDTKYELGYVIAVDDEQIRLIKKDGSETIVNMKSKVKIDGVSTDKDDVEGKLNSIAGLIGSTECYQPVRYNITNGELVALDTVADSTGVKATAVGSNSDDALVYNGTDNDVDTNTSQVTVDGKTYNFDSSTIVIYVPDSQSSGSDYSVMKPSTAFAAKPQVEKIEVLGADPEDFIKTATLVLMYGTDPAYTFTGKTPYLVVKEVRSGGETIIGYSDGASSTTTLTVSEDKLKYSGPDIGKGDIIRYIKNGNDVIAIEMVYDASEADFLTNAKMNYSEDQETEGKVDYDYYRAYTSGVGEVYIKYAEAVQVESEKNTMYVTTVVGETDEDTIRENLLTYKIDSSTVVYRVEGNEVVAENILTDISTTAGSRSEVIMITRSSTSSSTPTAKAIYIVK